MELVLTDSIISFEVVDTLFGSRNAAGVSSHFCCCARQRYIELL